MDQSLAIKLRRAGASCNWSPEENAYMVRSLYVPRFVGVGETEATAYEAYVASVQQPNQWRVVAAEYLPDLADEISDSENAMSFWLELQFKFHCAYDAPGGEETISRIYAFADWCDWQDQPETCGSDHLVTCVSLAFFEHIPTWERARKDMPNWFTLEEVESMREIFSYHFEDFDQIKALFRSQLT